MNKKVRFAFYGTLRPGDYNFARFQEGLTVVDTGLTLKGFEMKSLGPYPFIHESLEENVVVDIVDADTATAASIERMEYGAGYQSKKVNIGAYEDVTVFYYPSDMGGRFPKVTDGDWLKYKKKS
jgi:gamma-glutamylcyclotransferase (GGCT)/AIG2-like uncharacterized protein YtfP